MKSIVASILISGLLIGAAFAFNALRVSPNSFSQDANNVSIVDGKQIITIGAKGGYFPKITNAKAGMPTVIKVGTRGTFDCSSALTIPSLGISKNLPPTGETETEVPPQEVGTAMRGFCAMGMYNLSVNFK